MCLYKNKKYHPSNKPLVAKEDIVCYKQLEINYSVNEYETPCTHSKVPIECLTKKIPFKAVILNKAQFIWRHILGFSNIVENGFIHSHMYYPSPNFLYDVFKCIIPKGTKYFVGKDGDYASEQIIFLKQLK